MKDQAFDNPTQRSTTNAIPGGGGIRQVGMMRAQAEAAFNAIEAAARRTVAVRPPAA
jgi:hypothetical protein